MRKSNRQLLAPDSVFRHPEYNFLQAARCLTTISMQMLTVAVGWQVYELSGSPLELGFAGLAVFLPMMLLTLVGGDFADRFDKRKLIVLSFLLWSGCALLLLAVSYTGVRETRYIFSILALTGVARAFAGPATSALMPSLVPVIKFPRAVAWSTTLWQLSVILGPALGGVLYGASGDPRLVYGTCAGGFCIAIVLILLIKPRRALERKSEISSWQRLFAGIGYVRSQPIILGAISLDLFAVLLGGSVALLPIFAKDYFALGPDGLGLMRSAPALGATLMGIYLGLWPIERKVGIKMLLGVMIFGLATCLFGISRDFVLSMVCLAVIGAADMISVFVRQTLIQTNTENAMRGRVSAVSQVFIGASNELGEFESGLTADWFGTVPAVVVGGLGTCVVALLWAWRFPELKKVDRFQVREPWVS